MKVLAIMLLALIIAPALATESAEDVLYNAAMQSSQVSKAQVSIDSSHMGVTIEPSQYTTSIGDALINIMQAYLYCLTQMPEYNGYLRIGVYQGGKITKVYDVTAARMRQANQEGSEALAQLGRDVISEGRTLHVYDEYGDVERTVDAPGGRMSPAVGNWL